MRLYFLIEFVKPVFQAISVVFLSACGVLALIARSRTLGLVLLGIACFVSASISVVYLVGSLQTEWKITLLPVEVRRLIFTIADVLYLFEVFVWPAAIVTMIREHHASRPKTI